MEDLAVITALNHSGSFGMNFVKFKKNKYVVYRLRVGPFGEKLWPRPWAAFSRPRSQFFTIRTSHPANNIYVQKLLKFSRAHGSRAIFIIKNRFLFSVLGHRWRQNVWEQNSGRGVAEAPLKITNFRSEFGFKFKKKVSEHDERKRQGQNNDWRNSSFRELYSTLSICDIW